MNQIPAVRKASPKSLSPTNGNSMFLDEVEIEPQIQFSSLEREATRMVRSHKSELLFQIAKNIRGFKKSEDANFVKRQELLNRLPAARMASSKTVDSMNPLTILFKMLVYVYSILLKTNSSL